MSTPARMSTTATAPVELPVVRVSVLTPTIQVDVDLGYTIPLAEIVPALLRQLNSFLEAKGQDPLIGGKEFNQWTLGRIGYAPIPLKDTLKTAGVEDGDLLILQSIDQPQSPAMFDDVIDAVAQLQAFTQESWGAKSAEKLGYIAAVFFSSILAYVLHYFQMPWKYGPAIIGILLSLGFIISGTMQARFYKNTALANILQLSAYPLLFSGIHLIPAELNNAIDLSDTPNLSAIQYAVAFLTIAVTACVLPTVSLTGIVFHVTVVVIGLLGGIGAVIGIIWMNHTAGIAAIIAGISILGTTSAPRLAIMLARIPIPHVPTIGNPLQSIETEHRTIEGIGSLGSIVLPEAVALERRTHAAYEYHTGVILGSTISGAGAAILCAKSSGPHDWRGLLLALMISTIFCLRGRVHADRNHVGTLIIGGAITATASLLLVIKDAQGVLEYLCLLFLAALIPISLLSGTVGPKVKVSPLTRRLVEIFGYTLLALIIPLIFWISDIYAMARHR